MKSTQLPKTTAYHTDIHRLRRIIVAALDYKTRGRGHLPRPIQVVHNDEPKTDEIN